MEVPLNQDSTAYNFRLLNETRVMPTRGYLKSGAKGDKGAKKVQPVTGDQCDSGGDGGNPEVVIIEETVEGHTCKTCEGADTEEMVQCDKCDGWFHFSCVGVSEEVADKSWSCTNCVTAKWIQRTKTALEDSTIQRNQNLDRRSTRSQPVGDQPVGNIATSTRINPVIAPSCPQKPASVVHAEGRPADLTKMDQEKQQSVFPADDCLVL